MQTDFHCNCYHYFPSASHRLSMPLRSGGPNASKINQQPFQLLKSKFSIKKKPFTSNQNQNSLYFYNSPLVPMHSTVGPQRPPHQILHFKEDEEEAESCYTEPLVNIPITSDEVMPLKPDSPLSSNSGSSTPSDKKVSLWRLKICLTRNFSHCFIASYLLICYLICSWFFDSFFLPLIYTFRTFLRPQHLAKLLKFFWPQVFEYTHLILLICRLHFLTLLVIGHPWMT